MTEEEAKTKWCPHVRVQGDENVTSGNRFNQYESTRPDPTKGVVWKDTGVMSNECTCIGSGCMAWLWSDPEMETTEYPFMGGVPDGDGWVCVMRDEGRESMRCKSRWERKNPSRNGYCGLAGKP